LKLKSIKIKYIGVINIAINEPREEYLVIIENDFIHHELHKIFDGLSLNLAHMSSSLPAKNFITDELRTW